MKRSWVRYFLVLGFFSLMTHAKLSWASEPPAAPTTRMDYGAGVAKKLGRGVSNVAFGWLEIPKGIQDVGDKNNFIAGLTWGSVLGIGKAVVRTVAGAYEVVTFPFAIPDNFEPLVQPEFMLGDQW